MTRRYRAIFAWACGLALGAPTTHAVTIVLTDTGSTPMTAAQLAAFNSAADIWEGIFNDPITVNINIEFASLGAGILGSTQTRRVTHPYTTVRSAMLADATGSAEIASVTALPASSVPIVDINGVRSDTSITMSSANAKALGLGTGNDPVYGTPPSGGADARIQFATAFASSFDFDRSDGITGTQTDFVTVAAHEIGHVLGFFSLTDVQDGNAGFTLHTNTLDLWRFNETGGAHTIGSENRQLTAGGAEYYDSNLNNRQFSRGSSLNDPLCNSATSRCQASHWRDSLGNLMDPTVAKGITVNPKSDDKHALDYIGYHRPLFFYPFPWKYFIVKWFPWPPPVEFPKDPRFDPFAPPPDPRKIEPPFQPNLTAQMGLDLGIEGLTKRSGVGFAQFQNAMDNPNPKTIVFDKFTEGEQNINPPVPIQRLLPPTLMHFFFQSDDTAGVPFSFHDLFSPAGAQFDPSLGKSGGWLINGYFDGMGDQVRGDMDAMVSFTLLSDENGIPDPEKMNVFDIDPSRYHSTMTILDAQAFGISQPQWDVNGGGGWPVAGNWIGGSPDSPGAIANFLSVLTPGNAPAVVSLNGSRRMGYLTFDNDASYIIEPGQGAAVINMDNGGSTASIQVLNGEHTIKAPVNLVDSTNIDVEAKGRLNLFNSLNIPAGNTAWKIGPGALHVQGGVNMAATARLDVAEGAVNADRILGGRLIIRAGAFAGIDSNGANSGTSVLSSLLFDGGPDAWDGILDLRNNDLIVRATPATADSVLADLTNQVKTARNTAPLKWSGQGIRSSTAALFPGGLTGLAVIRNQDDDGNRLYAVFDGYAVDTSSILIKYTWNGDANESGIVDADDYFRIDFGFAHSLTGYYNGDFDYSETVNADDYFLIDTAFVGQTGALGGGAIAVPEPATLGLLCATALMLIPRRRR